MLIPKVEKKGRTRDEIDQVACWLTGYSKEQIADFLIQDIAKTLHKYKLVDELAKGKTLEKILRKE